MLPEISNADSARTWLESLNIANLDESQSELNELQQTIGDDELLRILLAGLGQNLGATSDPDRALANLHAFIAKSENVDSLIALFQRDSESLPVLLRILSTSQFLADQLISNPEYFDLIRADNGQPLAQKQLIEMLHAEVQCAHGESEVVRVLRNGRQRELLRIAYSDFIREMPLQHVVEQLSFLAEASIQASIDAAEHILTKSFGQPLRHDGSVARFSVIGLGKLGGNELHYGGEIELMFLHDPADKTSGQRQLTGPEYFDRFSQLVMRFMSEGQENGAAYRVQVRRPPQCESLCNSVRTALQKFDIAGTTWDRQLMIKARPVAGHTDLGREFLQSLQPWVYRRFLNRVDIAGIRHLKRRLERRARRVGDELRNVLSGHGGITDIEFSIQFLQLLNGGDLPPIRTGNTLQAITALEQVGCLTPQESTVLSENYRFLRSVEHHLQIMFDLDTHTVPETGKPLERFCRRVGAESVASFEEKLTEHQAVNRRILDHMLHDAFGDEESIPVETELVLDPEPSTAQIMETLTPYAFPDPHDAYRRLMQLAHERLPFLSVRRCRHFLAAIAPKLLTAIASTPDPMESLENLVRVSDSLGGKSALWELASSNPATLEMVVRLCSVGPYLNGILTSNPGMIDELMDSLIMDRLPQVGEMSKMATELCRGAEDVARILFSFRNSVHLRVGVRDILDKDDIQATHRALSDCAEICLGMILNDQYEKLTRRYGEPQTRDGRKCELVTLAVGRLGGQEPNYHSDLDLVFLYESEGYTKSRSASRSAAGTTNNHFFNQLCQRVCQIFNSVSPQGRLYQVDTKLRPSGGSSILAVPFVQLVKYFETGSGTLPEILSLCKARPVFGDPRAQQAALDSIRQVCGEAGKQSELGNQVAALRAESQRGASDQNLKRSFGGTMDVELAVQLLQLKHVDQSPQVFVPSTLAAIERLRQAEVLSEQDAETLEDGYAFLRRVESGLRLLNTSARHDLPTDQPSLAKLAYLLKSPDQETLVTQCDEHRSEIRRVFDSICEAN